MDFAHGIPIVIFLSHGSTATVGLVLLHEIPPSHSDTQHSVGLPWTSDRPVADLYLRIHNTRNPSKRAL